MLCVVLWALWGVAHANSNVFGWGFPTSRGLGNNATVPVDGFQLPQRISFFENLNETIVRIRSYQQPNPYGFSLSMAISDSGNVYMWGFVQYNNPAQTALGASYTTDWSLPRLAVKLLPFGQIEDCVYIQDLVKIFCRLENGSVIVADSVRLRFFDELLAYNIVDLQMTFGAVFALSDQGLLFAWGYDDRGQLGNGPGTSFVSSPQLVDFFPANNLTVVQIVTQGALTEDETSPQISAIVNNGSLYSWGWYYSPNAGLFPACLIPNTTVFMTAIHTPVLAPLTAGLRLKQVRFTVKATTVTPLAGAFVQCENGTWFICPLYNTLPGGIRLIPFAIEGVNVTNIIPGAEFGFAMTENGSVYTWGHDYKGNLGNSEDAVDESTPVLMQSFADAGIVIRSMISDSYATFAISNSPCLPGTSGGGCYQCPTGTFADTSSAVVAVRCTSCAPGTFTNASGLAACYPCPAGSYGILTGMTKCVACGAGTFSPPGSTACMGCSAGSISCASAGQCTPCAAGQTSTARASICVSCPPGHYSVPGSGDCTACPAGTYGSNQGVENCTACGVGAWSNTVAANSQVFCQRCPTLSTTLSDTATAANACICAENAVQIDMEGACQCYAGFEYKSAGVLEYCAPCAGLSYKPLVGNIPCVLCPINARPNADSSGCRCIEGYYPSPSHEGACLICPIGGDCSSGTLVPQSGYWLSHITEETLYECAPAVACVPTGCATGYVNTSVLCGVCDKDYTKLPSGECVYCPAANTYIVVFLILPAAIVLIAFVYWSSVNPSSPTVTSVLNFLQLVNETALIPKPVTGAAIGLFSFDLGQFAFHTCVGPLGYSAIWALQIILPLLLLTVFTLVLYVRKLVKRIPNDLFRNEFAACRLCILGFTYVIVSKAAISMFSCSRPIDGVHLLIADRSYTCWQGTHVTFVVLASLVLAFFCVGIPAPLSIVIYGPHWAPIQLLNVNVSFITTSYTDKAAAWEIVMMLRRLLFVLVAQVAADYYVWATIVLCLLALISARVQLHWQPFKSDLANKVEYEALLTLSVCCVLRLAQALLMASNSLPSSAASLLADICVLLISIAFIVFAIYQNRESIKRAWTDCRTPAGKRNSNSSAASSNPTPKPRALSTAKESVEMNVVFDGGVPADQTDGGVQGSNQ